MSAVKSLPLIGGGSMPILGFGTFLCKPGEVANAVKIAVKTGYRHIDCAFIYQNEAEIGTALKEIFQDPSYGVKRQDLFIVSKLWNTSHRKDQVKPAIQTTLKNLQLDYLDLYLIHTPISQDIKPEGGVQLAKVPIHETWQAMEQLVQEGLTKAIGVSNFNCALINDILSYAKIPPAVNQIERHPYLVQPVHVKWLKEQGIQITAYAPLGAPGLKHGTVLNDPVVAKLAEKYKKTPAQILVRWSIDGGVSVIPKSINEGRIKENFNVWDFQLTKEEVESLDALDKNVRYFTQLEHGVPAFW